MNRISTGLLLLVIASLTATAQINPYEVRQSLTSGIEFYTSNYGIFGLNSVSGTGSFYYPRGSGRQYIFLSGLWFGARKTSGGSLVDLSFITYDPNSGSSWGVPGQWSTEAPPTGTYRGHIAVSTDHDRNSGAYTPTTSRRPGWPLWNDGELAARLSDPGMFVADSASRNPAISGSAAFVPGVAEQFVSRYHDGYLEVYDGEELPGHPIGLQIEQNVYGFAQNGLDNVVILHYRIINISDDTLFQCYSAQMTDPDLGYAMNDHASFYTERPGIGTASVYSESTMNDGTKYGTLVQTLLESPAVETNKQSNRYNFIRHDKQDYDSTEQVGVWAFQNTTLEETPQTAAERYAFMTLNEADGDNGLEDVRTLLVAGPFNMLPGDTARFAVGLTVLPTLRTPTPGLDLRIEVAADRVLALYRAAPVAGIRENRAEGAAFSIGAVMPNPASGTTTVELTVTRRTTATVQLVDMLGRVVKWRESGMLEPGRHLVAVDLESLAPGMYRVVVEAGGVRESRSLVVSH